MRKNIAKKILMFFFNENVTGIADTGVRYGCFYLLLLVVVFSIDIMTPRGFSLWLIYVIPLLLASRYQRHKYHWIIPALLTTLILLAHLLKPEGISARLAFFNRSAAVVVVWVSSYLIFQRNRLYDAVIRNEEMYRTLIENANSIIMRWNTQGVVTFVNSHALSFFGYAEKEEMVGQEVMDIIPQKKISGRDLSSFLQDVLKSPDKYVNFENENVLKNGKRVWIAWANKVITDDKGDPIEVLSIGNDITERRRVQYVSFHDTTTGLYNRVYFEEELQRLDNSHELPISIIMGDVNNLKLTNDTFGHAEGDQLLKRIASIIKASCRQKDVIARWGGDEFVVILPRTNFQIAQNLVERIKKECGMVSDMVLPPSISLGISIKERYEENIEGVLRQAEDVMYKNKAVDAAKNQEIVITSILKRVNEKNPGMEDHQKRLEMLIDMLKDDLELTDSQKNDLCLMSWAHDVGKIVVPEEIIHKSSRLSLQEWVIIMKYPEVGYRIARTFNKLVSIADSILAHRERWDGKGYPFGIKGDNIPLLARIHAIFDAYDAMTHDRPYKQALSRKDAIAELVNHAGKRFDPNLVNIIAGKIANNSDTVSQ